MSATDPTIPALASRPSDMPAYERWLLALILSLWLVTTLGLGAALLMIGLGYV